MGRGALLLFVAIMAFTACRSVDSKRINKDIIGINEQIYELEKSQIESESRLKKIEKISKSSFERKSLKKTKNDLKEKYSNGYRYFLEEDYNNAILSLKKIVKQYANDKLLDNALFWLAESYFKIKDFKNALSYYKLIYRYFPFSEKADYALFKIGYIYYNKLKNYSKSNIAFIRLIKEYSDSDFIKSAVRYRNKIRKSRRKK